MQAKKKSHGRNDAREHASPRGGRSQRKVPDDSPVVGKKASGLIASARKQKSVSTGINAKQNGNLCALKIASNGSQLACHDTRVLPLECDDVAVMNSDCKASDEKTVPSASETIFSPSFHISKEIHGNKGIAIENCESDAVDVHCDNQRRGGEILSPEVSAIYLAMQHSKLECIDETHYYSEVYVEADEDEVFDDFDPYSFIGSLPDLSAIVPTFRPMLLPKQTRSCPSTTLVLDLDETLVHSTLDYCEDADFTFPVNFNLQEHTIYVRCRPYLKDFMERVSSLFEIIIFTASQSIYAEQLLNVLDPKRKIFRHRVYRESCVFVDGNYLKDLSVLGRDLSHVAIIDNSPQAFGFQVDNGIPIESWFDDRSDCELLSLLPFLESLVGVDDVRPVIAKRFNLREKVVAASYPSFSFSNGNGNPIQRKVK